MTIEEILQKHFNWTDEEIKSKGNTLEYIRYVSEEKALAVAKFYKNEFGLGKEDFIKMLKTLPAILGLSEENVNKKVEFYKTEFKLSEEDFIKMLKILPAILGYSEKSVKMKHKQILDLNISNDIIVNNPLIIAVPVNTLKLRYILLRQIATRKEILMKQCFLQNHEKTYARLKYLQDNGLKMNLACVLCSEKNFNKRYGVESKELIKLYKLTPKIINELKTNINEQVDFTKKETEYLNKEYGM